VNFGDDPTLSQLLDRWVAARAPEWSPKTTIENQRQIRLKIVPRLGHRRLSKIRAVDIDAFYAELRRMVVRRAKRWRRHRCGGRTSSCTPRSSRP